MAATARECVAAGDPRWRSLGAAQLKAFARDGPPSGPLARSFPVQGIDLNSRKYHSSGELELASPAGLEPATPGLGNRCSILLSYGDVSVLLSKYARRRFARGDNGELSLFCPCPAKSSFRAASFSRRNHHVVALEDERVLCPVNCIATRSGMPARTKFRRPFAEVMQDAARAPRLTQAAAHAFRSEPMGAPFVFVKTNRAMMSSPFTQ